MGVFSLDYFSIILIIIILITGWLFFWMYIGKEKSIAVTLANDRKNTISDLNNEITNLRAENTTLLIENGKLSNSLATQKNDLETIQSKFVEAFKNLSKEIVEDQSEKFDANSKKRVDQLINPLLARLNDFKEHVINLSSEHARERTSLRSQVKQMMDNSTSLVDETNRLTNALQGDFRKQGSWGELILERVLEAAGLTEGKEYIRNGEGLNLRGPDNEILKPDVVVMLPDKKHLVIDSKMTFPHYYNYCNTEDKNERDQYATKLVDALEEKIKNLSGKQYSYASGIESPDFVVMFIPIEAVFSLAVNIKPELIEAAWKKGVILSGPTNLFSILRTVACVWNIERQNKNSQEIADKGADLHDAFVALLELLDKLGEDLKKATSKYENVLTKIKGKQGLVTKVSQLKRLGLQTKKQIPEEFLEDDQESACDNFSQDELSSNNDEEFCTQKA